MENNNAFPERFASISHNAPGLGRTCRHRAAYKGASRAADTDQRAAREPAAAAMARAPRHDSSRWNIGWNTRLGRERAMWPLSRSVSFFFFKSTLYLFFYFIYFVLFFIPKCEHGSGSGMGSEVDPAVSSGSCGGGVGTRTRIKVRSGGHATSHLGGG